MARKFWEKSTPENTPNKKIHLLNGCCQHGMYLESKDLFKTTDLKKVTCSVCLRKIKKYNLQPRENFPDYPTFATESSADGEPGHVKFRCPCCGKVNYHGNGDGDRISHDPCWRGYNIIYKGKDCDNA